MMTYVTYFFVGLTIAGAVFNIFKHPFCFVLWLISTLYLVGYNIHIGEGAQALQNGAFVLLNAWGLYEWYWKPRAKAGRR